MQNGTFWPEVGKMGVGEQGISHSKTVPANNGK